MMWYAYLCNVKVKRIVQLILVDMGFTVSCRALCSRLEAFVGATTVSSVPEFAHFFFFMDKGEQVLHVRASNGEVVLQGEVPVTDVKGGFSICMPARLLLSQLKLLPEQPLIFAIDRDSLKVTVSISNGEFSFMGCDPRNFPELDACKDGHSTVSVSAKLLNAAIAKVISSVSVDTVRPAMTGVYFDFRADGLNLVATNGQRMAVAGLPQVSVSAPHSFIVGAKALVLLQKQLGQEEGDVTLANNEEHVWITGAGFVLRSLLVGSRFPSYNSVIPKDMPNVTGLDRETLIGCIKRVVSFSMQLRIVKMVFEAGSLTLKADDADFETHSVERFPLDGNYPNVRLCLNADYLIDYLSKMKSDQVDMLVSTDQIRPVLLTPSQQADDMTVRFVLMKLAD